MKNSEKGSITIEATISLTAFLFFFVTFISLLNVCRAQAVVATAIDNAAKDISQYSYIFSVTGLKDSKDNLSARRQTLLNNTDSTMQSIAGVYQGMKDQSKVSNNFDSSDINSYISTGKNAINVTNGVIIIKDNMKDLILDDPKEFFIGLLSLAGDTLVDNAVSALADPICKGIVSKHFTTPELDKQQLSNKMSNKEKANMYLKSIGVSGLESMDFTYSAIFQDGTDDIDIVVIYEVKVIQLLPIKTSYTFCQRASTKGWLSGK